MSRPKKKLSMLFQSNINHHQRSWLTILFHDTLGWPAALLQFSKGKSSNNFGTQLSTVSPGEYRHWGQQPSRAPALQGFGFLTESPYTEGIFIRLYHAILQSVKPFRALV